MSCDLKLEYLLRDRPYDPAVAPADYDMLCVKSGGAELYGEILWPDGGFQGPRPCVLLCHGYPGVARNDDLAAALRRSAALWRLCTTGELGAARASIWCPTAWKTWPL